MVLAESGHGSLGRALAPGLALGADVTFVDPYPPSHGSGLLTHLQWRRRLRAVGDAAVEAAAQLDPDAVFIVKGRGLTADDITRLRANGRPVVVDYPDNPFWHGADPHALERLHASDCAVIWSERIAIELRPSSRRVEVLPFGYDQRWYAPTDPGGDRAGVVFLGTSSPRRARFLRALGGLPLLVRGTGWDASAGIDVGPPVTERDAGRLLASAVVGVNLLHPGCAGAHNMRTREITACGALELTDPGTDGTPLRDGVGARWFHDPDELRAQVEAALAAPERAAEIAAVGQDLTIADTYDARAAHLLELIRSSMP
jgi:hypothetical protein